jgi:hypothetical protein
MKSQTTLQNRGFLTFEILLSLTLFSMLFPATIALSLSSKKLMQFALQKNDQIQNLPGLIQDGASTTMKNNLSFYKGEMGKMRCEVAQADIAKMRPRHPNITFGSGITGTDIVTHNGYIYESADSATRADPDVYIIDATNPSQEKIISSLSTGPGIAALAMSGTYLFLANEASNFQLQVVDISDRTHPVLINQLKLPPLTTSTSTVKASSIYSDGDKVYIGTTKRDGTEFSVVSVANPRSPVYLGGYEVGSTVHSIRIVGTYAYIATSDIEQLIVLDISNPAHIQKISSFSPDGSSILDGKAVEVSSTTLYFTRNGGGFNTTTNHELFAFDLEKDPLAQHPTISKDIPGGVYGLVGSRDDAGKSILIFVSGGPQNWIQFMSSDLSTFFDAQPLSEKPISVSCDHSSIFVPTSIIYPYTYIK